MSSIEKKSPGQAIYTHTLNFDAMEHENAKEIKGEYLLVYLGQNGQQFQLGYREFRANSIRKSFSENYTYQVNNEGTTEIAFRNITINVLKVSNKAIEYQIMSTELKEK